MACKGLAFSVTPLSINRSLPSSSSSSSSSFTVFSFLSRTSSSSFPSSSSSFPLILKRTPTPSPSVLFAFYSSKNKDKQEAEYKFPDPIPEFAEAETEKFTAHLLKKLSKKEEIFGESVEEVVQVCTEIFSTFLHTEYGGPGTLLVIPFIDMADALTEKGLPGSPQAARAAVVWAQKHVDKDWNEWTGGDGNADDDEDDDE